MAALGSCSSLLANASTTFINLNEVTTVAGAWSLARFMTSPTNAGTSATNVGGVENAFATANKIANLSTGAAPGPALPAGATLSVAEVNTLANILSSCVNSNGSVTSGAACATLFAAATPPAGSAPTDTLTAALNIAHYPGKSVPALFALASPSAVFQPALTTAPANWLIGIHHTGGGLAQPTGVAVDAAGNVWASNTANSVSEFSPIGAALSPPAGYTSGSLSHPSAIAIDLSGNAWVTNLTDSVTRIAPLGASATNFTAGGFNQPSSIAIDGSGNVWVANGGNGTVSGLSSMGSVIPATPFSGAGISSPAGIAISAQ
jgi:streptogramin lyase